MPVVNPNPIGIFDSGVGGISVMKEIRQLLPAENIFYFADSAHCPYGLKSPEEIRRRIIGITRFMLKNKAKIIVAACNTASIAGLDFLRQMFKIPIIGMEPAIKPAVTLSRNGKIGVMATGVTLSGDRFQSLIKRYANGSKIIKVACPGLVEQVERGLLNNNPDTEAMLRVFLQPLIDCGVDTLVLGCTHYPFLRGLVELIMGPEVKVIDTGAAVAKRVMQVLHGEELLNNTCINGTETFFTSGEAEQVEKVIRLLWHNKQITTHHLNI